MNRNLLLLIALLGTTSTIHAWQETRTPLSLWEGYMHYDFDRDRELNEHNLDAHFWTGIYFRSAPNAYNCSGCKEPLAALYFGKSTFTLEEAFANSTIPAGSTINPFVILTPITINIDYREQGVWFGTTLSGRFGCDDQWSTGVRVRAPFRDIKVEPLCGNPITNNINPVANLFQQRVESIQVASAAPVTQNVFAARLDALEAMNRVNFNVNGAPVPMVTYPATDILIAGQNASGGVSSASPVTDLAPFLAVIESTNGLVPASVRWADVPQNGTVVLNGDGSGLANLQRGRVASDVNYTSLGGSATAASHLFVVPNVQGASASTPGAIIGSANTVYSDISTAFENLANTSLADFTNQVGLNACYGNTRGFGDTNFEFFVAYSWQDYAYAEGRLWFTAPTGVKVNNPLNILKFPTGNNGHAELGLGFAGGIEPLDWLAFNGDLYVIGVLPANNNVAAPFVGASVKNIGPCVAGKTSWTYGLLDLNVTFINPCLRCMGVMFGYEGYFKGRDTLTLCRSSAVDWAGNTQILNSCVYTKNTERIAHRIRTETFFQKECLNIFLGFEATVAGKNIPAEVDYHIGFDVYF